MATQFGFLQRVFRAAMGARRLHLTKLALSRKLQTAAATFRAERLIRDRIREFPGHEFPGQLRVTTGLMLGL